jgi:hypothetical protein
METISRKDLNLAWLAGLIDADGCISMRIQRQRKSRETRTEYPVPYTSITTTCSLTSSYLIELFKSLNLPLYVQHKKNGFDKDGNPRKPVWHLLVNGLGRNERFLPLVLPFLVTKHKEAELMLEFIAIRKELFAQKKRSPREFAILAELKRLKEERNIVRNPHRLYARLLDGDDIVGTAWRHAEVDSQTTRVK